MCTLTLKIEEQFQGIIKNCHGGHFFAPLVSVTTNIEFLYWLNKPPSQVLSYQFKVTSHRHPVSLALGCFIPFFSLNVYPRLFSFRPYLSISADSLPPGSPGAPFSTVCQCRSIHSHSLSGSFVGCSPDHILHMYPVCFSMDSQHAYQKWLGTSKRLLFV